MSDHEVKYTLSLKDLLTGKIKSAQHATDAFTGSIHNAKNTIGEFAGVLGVAFGGMQIVEFVEKSEHAFHELHMAEVQLENTLANVGDRADITGGQMIEMASKMAQSIPFTQAQIVNMEGSLARFKNISKETFESSVMASADLAVALHRDGTEVARSLGRILEAPAQNSRLLRQFGLSLTKDQQALIKHLQETGHVAEAQKIIFQQLAEHGYGGAAKAAADADPLFRYHKIIEDIQLKVGALAIKLQQALAPVLERIVTIFKNSIEWMQKHKLLVEGILYVVGGALVVYGAYMAVIEGIAIATKIWTGIQWLLNAAITANPIGIMVVAIGAAVGAVIFAYKHFAKFRAVLWGLWEFIKEFGRIVADVFVGLGKVITGVLTFNPAKILEGGKQALSAVTESGARLGGAFQKGFNEGMADFAKDEAAEKAAGPKSLIKKGTLGDPGADGKTGAAAKTTGNKSETINISIHDGLIKQLNFNVTNMKEGMAKVKEAVTQVILGAVNDSQIIAGQ